MKRAMLAWTLCALMILSLCAPLSALADDYEDGFGFDAEGYDGTWIRMEGLNLEFCLPDDWQTAESPLTYETLSADARMSVYIEAENVVSLSDWGEANLDAFDEEAVGFYDALITEQPDAVRVRILNKDDQVLCFEFVRASARALPLDRILEMVGSVDEAWMEGE